MLIDSIDDDTFIEIYDDGKLFFLFKHPLKIINLVISIPHRQVLSC